MWLCFYLPVSLLLALVADDDHPEPPGETYGAAGSQQDYLRAAKARDKLIALLGNDPNVARVGIGREQGQFFLGLGLVGALHRDLPEQIDGFRVEIATHRGMAKAYGGTPPPPKPPVAPKKPPLAPKEDWAAPFVPEALAPDPAGNPFDPSGWVIGTPPKAVWEQETPAERAEHDIAAFEKGFLATGVGIVSAAPTIAETSVEFLGTGEDPHRAAIEAFARTYVWDGRGAARGIHGAGDGVEAGREAIVVFAEDPAAAREKLPATYEGYPLVVVQGGPFEAQGESFGADLLHPRAWQRGKDGEWAEVEVLNQEFEQQQQRDERQRLERLQRENPKKILFWSAAYDPNAFVGKASAVPPADREAVVQALRDGQELLAFRGMAQCRICGVNLGNKDLCGHGYTWPEGTEHYVVEHGVWTPEHEVLRKALHTEA